jgi:pimeloyl-ACP methyl ester carboxylesterase
MKKRYWIAGASGLAGAAVAAKLLTRPVDVDWERSADLVYHRDHSHFIEVEGVPVHYQAAGDPDAPPLILIHGFVSSTLVWAEVFLPLASAGFRVIVPDLLGYGFSGKPVQGDYTIEAQAHMIVGLMRRLEIPAAILVGSSYGGAVAATVALDHPDRVQRLVLIGAVTNDEPKKFLLLRATSSPLLGDVLAPLLLGSRWVLRQRMKRSYHRSGRVFDENKLATRHHALSTVNTQRAVLRTLRRWHAAYIQREAHLIKQPTLLIWGENDPEIPLSDGEHLRDAMPNARLIVFRKCGHLPQEEFPQQFVQVVVGFCQEPLAAIAEGEHNS